MQVLSAVGKGCPDLLVGWQSRNILIEVKVPKLKGQQAGALTPDQTTWHGVWMGRVHIVHNCFEVEDILSAPSLKPTDRIGRQAALEKVK